jgi:microcompartment protein CcmK/EutM
MLMAKVIGSIVSTQKEETLVGKKLMIIQFVNHQGELATGEEVACDAVGAGVGEYVLVTKGHGARSAFEPRDNVIDLSIVAIIDRFDT